MASSNKLLLDKNVKLQQKLNDVEFAYHAIAHSTCWRLTSPVRKTIDQIKTLMKRIINANRYTILAYKGLKSLKRDGFSATISRIRSWENRNYYQGSSNNLPELNTSLHYSKKFLETSIDVIIPVFNGYEHLLPCLESIGHTSMKCQTIIVEDKSTDARVLPFLRSYAQTHANVILLENEQNLGFVQSVNKALFYSKDHVALVNTDVIVPAGWLERLMFPIVLGNKVASSTPFTNSGTICSFPDFCKDNLLFEDLPLQTIDFEFQRIKPKYTKIPTGVGFCMGINRKTIDEIGVFDAETFGKGYGEENDWCQRAIKHGYSNVHVENLFVYHKHGGSFLSREKIELIKAHSVLLSEKHPAYNADVALFCQRDPVKNIRKYIMLKLLNTLKKPTILAFDHNLGGGASAYLTEKRKSFLHNSYQFIVVRFMSARTYKLEFSHKDQTEEFTQDGLPSILTLLPTQINEIWVNELVTYPDIFQLLKVIRALAQKKNSKLIMLMHDYYSICPRINLLNNNGIYCQHPSINICNKCIISNNKITIYDWRKNWQLFLKHCDFVIAFSEDTIQHLKKTYPTLHNILLKPHKISFLPPVCKINKTTSTLNIGILGVLAPHKGVNIIQKMLKIIEMNNFNISIKLIGYCESSCIIHSRYFSETGFYQRSALPKLVYENDIDIFLVPSICPETFSYTTAEIMAMQVPIAVFNLGAPVERVRKYAHGLIVTKPNAAVVLNEISEFMKNMTKKVVEQKKVLFITQQNDFASRYRVEHFREQLIVNAISSDCINIDEISLYDLIHYNSIVIYRCSSTSQVRNISNYAKKLNISVFYDIDDYVFDYDDIRYLHFLQDNEYKDFKNYCGNIRKCMGFCDAFLTSTDTLATVIKRHFPDKSVQVNRNVASMEMEVLSEEALLKKATNQEKIYIGYFSGSHTHNMDFLMIVPALFTVMAKHQNVFLKLGGCIEVPPQLLDFKNRITIFPFTNWKQLPNEIASVDINLAPLEDTLFHHCKSENKWLEAALVKTVSVISDNPELCHVISSWNTGILCKTQDDWRNALEILVTNHILRATIAENAYVEAKLKHLTRNTSRVAINFILSANHFFDKEK